MAVYTIQLIREKINPKTVQPDDIEETTVEAADMPTLRERVSDICKFGGKQLYNIVGLDPRRFKTEGIKKQTYETAPPLEIPPEFQPKTPPVTPTAESTDNQPTVTETRPIVRQTAQYFAPVSEPKYTEFTTNDIKFRVNLSNGVVEKFDFVEVDEYSDFKVMMDDMVVPPGYKIFQRKWTVVKSA